MNKLEKRASKIIGEGKTPNIYFVSLSNDYLVWDGDCMQGAEINSTGNMIGEYKTYAEALSIANQYPLGCRAYNNDFTINRVTIEDRISGTIYEHTRCFYPDSCAIEDEEFIDIQFTKDKLGKDFK